MCFWLILFAMLRPLVVCLSACMSVCVSACLLVCMSAFLSVCMSVCLSVCLSVGEQACVSACVRVPVFWSVSVSASLSACLCVCLSACVFVCLGVQKFGTGAQRPSIQNHYRNFSICTNINKVLLHFLLHVPTNLTSFDHHKSLPSSHFLLRAKFKYKISWCKSMGTN